MKPPIYPRSKLCFILSFATLLTVIILSPTLQASRGNDPTGASDPADPYATDSDGDGFSDGIETDEGTDPINTNDFPSHQLWIRKGANGFSYPSNNPGEPYNGYCEWGFWKLIFLVFPCC